MINSLKYLTAVLLMSTVAVSNGHAEGSWIETSNPADCFVWISSARGFKEASWSGSCPNGKAEGRGVLKRLWKEQYEEMSVIYEGGMIGGKENGEGKLTFEKPALEYVGQFSDGKMHGRGSIHTAKGFSYEGDFKNGEFDGHGSMEQKNGDSYNGDFLNGKYDGHGILVRKNGDRHEGAWKNGKREGHGVFTVADGDRCEGIWHKDKLLGNGEATLHGKLFRCRLSKNSIEYFD
jgi:hypothetical protein